MKFIRINNINPTDPSYPSDYKGLDISLFKGASALYDEDYTYCYTITLQKDIPVHADIIEVTEAEYLQFKSDLENRPTLQDPIELLREEYDSLKKSQLEQDELIMELYLGGM
ncbi:hypothetical protein [Paenibacillus antarcticus]|uniref:Uncharacterized protein n=1 Tax=Paenibacillus antarcticus TaxID=253703 RepID=A0A168P9I4_9BACL|nr:hypothetical protein [Paenibacillus antarcticus]OAB46532.1 hypothetical protein PBAT_10970 [Paenibacillus antarcticus]